MILRLLEFWPVFIPLLLYVAWQTRRRRHAHRRGEDKPNWLDGPWYWAVLATLALAIVVFLWWGFGSDAAQGKYIPPHLENGAVVPGHVTP